MNKEILSVKQCVTTMCLFITGNLLIVGASFNVVQDVWIVILIGMLFTLPAYLVYTRILNLYPGKNLFELSELLFGKFFGRIIILLYTWYAFHTGSIVIRNFTAFIRAISLPETPSTVISLMIIIICIWAVKEGIEVIGRLSSIVFPALVLMFIVLLLLVSTDFKFENLKPILYDGIGPLISGGFSCFSFPFADAILLTTAFHTLQNPKDTKKVFMLGLIISGALMTLSHLRNVLILGNAVTMFYYPSHAAFTVIDITKSVQRIEVLVADAFTVAGIIKACICQYAAVNGAAKLLNLNDYRQLVAPTGLLMAAFSEILYTSTLEMFEWNKIYKYYAIPFQIVLPLIILAAGLIRTYKAKAQERAKHV